MMWIIDFMEKLSFERLQETFFEILSNNERKNKKDFLNQTLQFLRFSKLTNNLFQHLF